MDGNVLATGYRLLLCITGSLLAVFLLRAPLRYAFGSRIAYRIWLLVPITVIGLGAGSLAPMRAFTPVVLPVQVTDVRLPWSPLPPVSSPPGQMNWVFLSWVLGAALFVLLQGWQQYTFVRRLGVLRHGLNGAWMSESTDIGPAVVGVLPPRIVLPVDFYERFTVPEQAFVLTHESMHILRRDPLANFVAAMLRSLLWFHPLIHLAVRYFRIDQELACDAEVLGAHPQDRHHYARAILKGHLGGPALPAGCRLDSHAAIYLKRRILMLQATLPSRWRRVFGTSVIAISVIATGGWAWAQSPRTLPPVDSSTPAEKAEKSAYELKMKLWENSTLKAERVLTILTDGRSSEIEIGRDPRSFSYSIALSLVRHNADLLLFTEIDITEPAKVDLLSDGSGIRVGPSNGWGIQSENILKQKEPLRFEWKTGALEIIAQEVPSDSTRSTQP